jgi:hypothetical protein
MSDEKISELNALIEAHNKAEAERTERLRKVYDLLAERKGFRRIAFGGGLVWSNCWDHRKRDEAHRVHVELLARPIVEVIPGAAKTD